MAGKHVAWLCSEGTETTYQPLYSSLIDMLYLDCFYPYTHRNVTNIICILGWVARRFLATKRFIIRHVVARQPAFKCWCWCRCVDALHDLDTVFENGSTFILLEVVFWKQLPNKSSVDNQSPSVTELNTSLSTPCTHDNHLLIQFIVTSHTLLK